MVEGKRLLVVVPAFNEEESIEATVSSLPSWIDSVVVVDDASTDRTQVRAIGAGARVVRHRKNRGVGAAIVTGYHVGLDEGFDAVIVMAGDGQMDPSDLPMLLAPFLADEADYVKGNRFAHQDIRRVMPVTRQIGNVVLSNITKVTSGYTHVFDSQCGYTLISRRALSAIALERLFPRYGYPNDLLARLNGAGMRVVDVPVKPVYGQNWKSGVKWHTAIHPISFVLMRSWWTRMRSKYGPVQPPQGSQKSSSESLPPRQRS